MSTHREAENHLAIQHHLSRSGAKRLIARHGTDLDALDAALAIAADTRQLAYRPVAHADPTGEHATNLALAGHQVERVPAWTS